MLKNIRRAYSYISLEQTGALSILKFNRPKKYNAINPDMYDEIGDALRKEKANDSSSLLAITGEGSYYSSGNDLTAFAKWMAQGKSQEEMAETAHDIMVPFVDAFIEFDKPMISVVNGPAVGIGVSHLGLADFVYAHESATFYMPFTILGQSAEACSSVTFPKIMGPSDGHAMIMFNKKIDAEEAKNSKLVGEIYSDDGPVWQKIEEYSKLPKKSLKYSKQLVRTAADVEFLKQVNLREAARLRERWASPDCAEAIMKFLMRKG
ncbi:Oidioi.mRNA.OKI2018_I69.chr1.g3097.t1.cds [Oikopleura dioica]|uniref:Oidioi.mRNA.OKI2018_I69.chr1.g3097.t1.cds n=1 Tax=Oikopleura dioica TaxID=34765 RepID=A0ABN7SXG3_OIKDI|nr:Oidioi.mRNA.OKI2018_I69.chr1.g3097.t1.cds [Oikopleura dioica]